MIYKNIRPITLDKLYGEHLDTVKNDIGTNSIKTPYLFYGPRGTGKTTMGLIIGSFLPRCQTEEINIAELSTLKDARSIIKRAAVVPMGYTSKLVILNEMHRASVGAESALNDILEFTPKNVYFVMTTTDISKILVDIRSRSKKVEFKKLSKEDITQVLSDGREACVEKSLLDVEVVSLIYEKSEGCARDALSELELLSDTNDKEEMLKRLRVIPKEDSAKVIDFFNALFYVKPWKETVKFLNSLNQGNPEGLRRTILSMVTGKVLREPLMDKLELQILNDIMRVFNKKIYVDFKDLVEGCLDYYHGE